MISSSVPEAPFFLVAALAHILMFAFGIGVFFLLAYAVREWRPADLRRTGLWLVGASVGCFLLATLVILALKTAAHRGWENKRCPMSDGHAWMMQQATYPEDGYDVW